MWSLGALSFAAPWLLLALALLPLLWWLLRATPPRPKQLRFPAIRLLADLEQSEETPHHTPWWLLALRLLLCALIILALAEPLWRQGDPLDGNGPLAIIVDNGWTAAPGWERREAALTDILRMAADTERPVAVIGTADRARGGSTTQYRNAADIDLASLLGSPHPWLPERSAALERLRTLPRTPRQIVWLSDGLDHGQAASFADDLAQWAPEAAIEVMEPETARLHRAVLPPQIGAGAMEVTGLRLDDGAPASATLRVLGDDDDLMTEVPMTWQAGETMTQLAVDLPLELRNEVRRFELAETRSAGAVALVDERWSQRRVGLISGSQDDADSQPLLSDLYYVRRALMPFATLLPTPSADDPTPVATLIEQKASVIILADIGRLAPDERAALTDWVARGGVLLRFAGPHLAAGEDVFVPVPLRRGGREIGGMLSWTQPQALAPFGRESPFAGLDVPEDVEVTRQVLAEPSADLSTHSWARLEDGTPLVTTRREGRGLLVLFHVTAGPDWSNLPLSGLFVEMLRRIVDLAPAGGVSADAETATGTAGNSESALEGSQGLLSPRASLDGFGRLGPVLPGAIGIDASTFETTRSGPMHPPGYYGRGVTVRALNTVAPDFAFTALGALRSVDSRGAYPERSSLPLAPYLFLFAAALFALDMLASLFAAGRLPKLAMRRTAGAALLAVSALTMLGLSGTPLQAQSTQALRTPDNFALQAAATTPLAYVKTGDARVDNVSQAGLAGLTKILRERTAFEPGPPMGVDLETDDLAFFPILYWPMTEAQADLSPAAVAKLETYMDNGGMVVIDTQDRESLSGVAAEAGAANTTLQRLSQQLNVPPLEVVPPNHVLSRSFYLVPDYPGRWSGGELWIEAPRTGSGGQSRDGVASLIVGSNDYAGAWAINESGNPMFATVPGSERQREIARRFGVNLVMYALTGNYKADQVHVPALLERLGQ